jgi:energy-coupling factor transport system ATP-binding protein
MTTLTTAALRLRYPAQPTWAVDDVTLAIHPREITWLTGALGAGTSTLLLALAGLAPRLTGGERSGTVRFGVEDPATLAPLPSGIAYLGPTPALQLSGIGRTVRDEVAIGPMNLGWPVDRLRTAVEAVLTRLEIAHLADRAPRELSGGEQQRVLLAALAVTAPRLWLLDEPFSALDAAGRAHVGQWLRELAEAGAVVVIACDEADTMRQLADRMLVMERGRVVLDGEPDQILAGDALAATGAATTEAATLAALAHLPAPRPLDTESLLARVELAPRPLALETSSTAEASDAPALLDCRGVHFDYRGGPPVLRGVDLAVHAGDAVGLFGVNGAGKSTLLRLAMALDHPREGVVRVLGRETRRAHPEDFAPTVGFLFQQPERQLFSASVRAECAVGPRLAGWSASRIGDAVSSVLEELGLMDAADEHPYDLPLPRRRLVALAAVLSTDPTLLLLDEPTAALDGASRDRVAAVIRARVARGRAVVAITHDAVFAHEALDRGVLLVEGRVAMAAPTRAVLGALGGALPAALAVAAALELPAGGDRRVAVSRGLLRHISQ